LSDDPQPQAFQLQKYLRRSRPLVASFAVKPLPLRREIEIHWIPGKLNEDTSASTLAALTSAAALLLTRCFAPVKLVVHPSPPFSSEGKSVRAETRHQLKQDAFSRVTFDAAEKTADWTVAHRSTLIISVVAVAIVLAAVIGGWYYLSAQDEKASFDLSQAVRTLDTPLRPAGTPAQPDVPSFTSAKERAQTAQKQFQAIVDKYPHTRTADMAHYFLGVTATHLSDNAAAERSFKQVASAGNREVAAIAKSALASLYGQTNRTKEAVVLYQELINKPTASVSKVTAQLQLAELYQNSNQPLDAKRVYEQIKKENPGVEAGQLATQKLAELK
jgi:tetratricopeptide (TPR) repeat protein